MQDVGLHPREAELGILQVIGWLVDGWGRSTMPVVVQCCRKAAPGSVKRYSAAGQQEYRTGFERRRARTELPHRVGLHPRGRIKR